MVAIPVLSSGRQGPLARGADLDVEWYHGSLYCFVATTNEVCEQTLGL